MGVQKAGPMAPLPLAKLGGVLIKQAAKPLSNRLISQAKDSPLLRSGCIWIGQQIHVFTVTVLRRSDGQHLEFTMVPLRTPYLLHTDSKDTDSDVYKRGFLKKDKVVTFCPKPEMFKLPEISQEDVDSLGEGPRQLVYWRPISKSGDKGERQYAWIPEHVRDSSNALVPVLSKKGVKMLPEDEALDIGAVFLTEVCVFGIAALLLLVEYRRSSAQAAVEAERKAKEKVERMRRKEEERGRLVAQNQEEIVALKQNLERQAVSLSELRDKFSDRDVLFSSASGAVAGVVAGVGVTLTVLRFL